MKARKKIIQGSTSAGKTYGIIPILIDTAMKVYRKKITVVAETIPAVKEGAVDIFKNVMYDTYRWDQNNWLGNPLEYTFPTTGTKIQFKSFPTVGAAKAAGKRDILFINEGNHIPYNIADALMIRSKETYITYLDNEALPSETLEDLLIKRNKAYYDPEGDLLNQNNIKSSYWANWWQVYGLGNLGLIDGIVYPDWKIIDKLPIEARLLGTGLDFGFTNDPTAAIDVYKLDDGYILDEVLYRKGLHNNEIYALLKDKRNVYADSAEPKSISELRRYGLGVRGAVKGKDSIMFGVQILQSNKIFVTSQSTNLIKEMRNYSFDKDRAGNTLNKPIDAFNHCMDAARYAASELIGNKNQGKYRIARV